MAPKAAMARTHVQDETGQVPLHAPGLGLAEDEIVLRGGFLKGPVIFGGCTEVGGAMFMPLLKSDPVFSNFLSPRPCNKRPLKGTHVPEELQKLRNKFVLTKGEDQEVEHDYVQDLGLGGEVSSKKRRVYKDKAEKTLPQTVVVVYKKEGFPDWRVRLLVDKWVRYAPSMEVSAENLKALFERVRADLEDGEVKRERFGGPDGAARKPKGPREKRRFWIGTRWLEKRRMEQEGGAATGSDDHPEAALVAVATAAKTGSRAKRAKFRTLRVAPSHAASPPRQRGRPRKNPQAATSTDADLPVDEAGLQDDFAL